MEYHPYLKSLQHVTEDTIATKNSRWALGVDTLKDQQEDLLARDILSFLIGLHYRGISLCRF